jgi:ribosomal protein S18 acetylase RimI-like enzyme
MIRQLTEADVAAFRSLRLEALQLAPEAYGSTLADWQDAGTDRFAARIADSWVAGAFDGGDLVGVAALDRERGTNVRHRAAITAVYVTPAARRRGHAGALLDRLAAEAAAQGIVQLELHVAAENGAAIALYERAGFQNHGLIPRALLVQGRFIDERVMIRRLDGADPQA